MDGTLPYNSKNEMSMLEGQGRLKSYPSHNMDYGICPQLKVHIKIFLMRSQKNEFARTCF